LEVLAELLLNIAVLLLLMHLLLAPHVFFDFAQRLLHLRATKIGSCFAGLAQKLLHLLIERAWTLLLAQLLLLKHAMKVLSSQRSLELFLIFLAEFRLFLRKGRLHAEFYALERVDGYVRWAVE
jgi:hypothetical protein